jgi:hypothetical protein
MSSQLLATSTPEHKIQAVSGWPMLLFNVALLIGALAFIVLAASGDAGASTGATAIRVMGGLLVELVGVALLFGYFTLQPNEARVLILFGDYRGTVRSSGFHWANPFYARNRGNVPPKAGTPADSGHRNRFSVRPTAEFDGISIAHDEAVVARAQLQ